MPSQQITKGRAIAWLQASIESRPRESIAMSEDICRALALVSVSDWQAFKFSGPEAIAIIEGLERSDAKPLSAASGLQFAVADDDERHAPDG